MKVNRRKGLVDEEGIYCLYANADQLLNKMDDLKMMITNKEPDLMFFTEVIPKAQKNPIEETQIKIEGYQHYPNFNYSDTNLGSSGNRGVVIYVKDDFRCRSIKLQSLYEDHVWVEIYLQNGRKMLCGCVYRSPTKDKKCTEKTTRDICNVIKEACGMENCTLLVCGDFNYPDVDWTNEFAVENTSSSQFLNMIQDCYLYQHIFKPTRYRQGNEPSLLDLILTSEKGILQNLKHNPGLGESDHECIDFTLDGSARVANVEERPNYFKGDYPTIRQRLKQVDWEIHLQGDFIMSYSNFIKVLENAMLGCIPKYKSSSSKKNMYLTSEAIRKKDLKNKLWRRYKKTRSSYDLLRYKKAKNKLRKLTRTLRSKFENNILKDLKTAPKKFWSYVKSKTKLRSKIPTLKKHDGTDAVSGLEKAEALNDLFCSTFTDEDLSKLNEIPI